MRVISGKYKGRVLEGFNLDGTRPTMDRVKESLFGMIQDYIDSSVVLDLFAGSGNLGIEALSEGASYVYFVDKNKKAINIINNNISKLGDKNIEIINSDYKDALKYLKDKKFDLIFLDPPYNTDYIEKSIKLIDLYDLVDDGLIICESDSLDKIIYSDKYTSVKSKKYGDKYIVILKKI